MLNCLNVRDTPTDQCTGQKHEPNVTKSMKFKSTTSKVRKPVSTQFINKKQPT